MHRPPLHFFALLLALLPLLAPPRGVFANFVDDGRFGNRTLEGCSSSDDCASDLACVEFVPEGDDQFCDPIFSEHPCYCIPYGGGVSCNTSDDWCPRDEGCGLNTRLNDTRCVACSVLLDGSSNFSPVDSRVCVASPTPFPTPSPSPTGPLRRSLDLCSPTDCCDDDLKCIDSALQTDCSHTSVPCRCLSETNTCESSADCHERDVCAVDVLSDDQICASCNVLLSVPSLTTADPFDTTCAGYTKRPPPSYPPNGNGRSLESCQSALDCAQPLQCFADVLDGELCNPRSFGCVCGSLNGKPCKRSTQCLIGESCATLLRINRTECVSNTFLATLYPDEVIIKKTDPIAEGSGRTLDPCMFDWDCAGERRCTHLQEAYGQCRGRRACSCVDVALTLCTESEQCPRGEVCSQSAGSRISPYCISRKVVRRDNLLYEFGVDDEPTTVPRGGYSQEGCLRTSDCEGDRVCRHFLERKGTCVGDRNGCVCVPKKNTRCETSEDCVPEELCLRLLDDTRRSAKKGDCVSRDRARFYPYPSTYEEVGAPSPSPVVATASPSGVSSEGPVPATVSATPSLQASESFADPPVAETEEPSESLALEPPSPSVSAISSASPTVSTSPETSSSEEPEPSEEPCVDVELLKGLDESELVFGKHRRASVLCDGSGSCATAGHLVVYKGDAMMMRSYCAAVEAGCTRAVRWVNSPRMGRTVRVASKTEELTMTALAARYQTLAEEVVLAQLARMGF